MSDLKQPVIELYNAGVGKREIGRRLRLPESTVRNWIKVYKSKVGHTSDMQVEGYANQDVPLSEVAIPKLHEATAQEALDDLRKLAEANPEMAISRNYYRVHGKYSESTWSQYFGTFHEYKRQAGIVLSRQQHNLEKHIAKHASVDHYRKLNEDRRSYGNKYDKPNTKRFKQAVILGDLHDKNADQFALDVLFDTLKRIQPDAIIFNGDLWDACEFGKYTIDPREWDVVGRLKFVHENILAPIREICHDAEITLLEGNHEQRLLKHLADATPALRAMLSDLHGFTVGSLLGLDKYEVNYVAKGDLSAYTLGDNHKEIKKNYTVCWESFIVSHYPDAKNLGFPGVNGHHHKTVIDPMYNEHFGSYSWIQAPCLHKLDAEYCHPKWQQGFVIATCDTETRQTVFDTVTFSENFAVVGGKFYERNPS